jgi:hypothetical protein
VLHQNDTHIANPLNNALGECEQHLINIVELFLSFLKTGRFHSGRIWTSVRSDKVVGNWTQVTIYNGSKQMSSLCIYSITTIDHHYHILHKILRSSGVIPLEINCICILVSTVTQVRYLDLSVNNSITV